MKNPISTILGIIQLLIPLIALVAPNLLGIDWSDTTTQQDVIASIAGILNGVSGLILIFKGADPGNEKPGV